MNLYIGFHIIMIQAHGLQCTAQVHLGSVRIHFC